ncbi:superoxide dismutase [Candidatus Peregrinibacteria bacterium]|nr:superoxide dismutase [Candidatus Peregrinibacteria bacterium]
MPHVLTDLPYDFSALEPYIDAKTMQIHHDMHHGTYVKKLNEALIGTGLEETPLEELLRDLSKVPEEKRTAIKNHGGGHFNHTLFWGSMMRNGGGMPSNELKSALEDKWSSFETFRKEFSDAAATLFGSGWAWLSLDTNGQPIIHKTPNQDTPLAQNFTPLLCLDVWEHAYYLHYQNRRPQYIDAFFNIINWPEIEKRYKESRNRA